jgi:uncharacterized protein
VGVLGIVAINVSGFFGPQAATLTPTMPGPASGADEAVFAALFLLFEGKMRALFSLLFGASMLLLIDRAEAAGRDGNALQGRRLLWLAAFGYLHYILLWWGDILFVYAICGLVALGLRGLSNRALIGGGIAFFLLWALAGTLTGLPQVIAEEHLRLGLASPAQTHDIAQAMQAARTAMAADIAQAHLPFLAMASSKLHNAPFWPLVMTSASFGETLPLMLIGMGLYRTGIASSRWPRRWLWWLAISGLTLGLAMAIPITLWAWQRHFPPIAMPDILAYWAGPEHLLIALGLYATLILAAPRLLAGWLGQRLAAAGQVAFSNYLGTSLALSFAAYGWGLGLFGKIPHAQQPWVVLAVWAVMLSWSKPWLAHFRQGPLEWVWRSLVERRQVKFRR